MAQKNTAHPDPEQVIEQSLNRFELFLERQGKTLLVALGVIVLIVGGYFAYKYLYVAPRTEKAAAAMAEAQRMFQQDSFALALNGDIIFDGFLAIADQYGSTPQGNLANHYAGICLLYMGDYEGAVNAFKAYKPAKKGNGGVGVILTAQNYGLTGDAYVEWGNLEEGVKMYEKAVEYSDNNDTAPKYLKKAAGVNEALGNVKKALEQYKRIKTDYSRSFEARDIDKYIAKAQQGIE